MEVKTGVPIPKDGMAKDIQKAVEALKVGQSLHIKRDECTNSDYTNGLSRARANGLNRGKKYVSKKDLVSYNVWRVK